MENPRYIFLVATRTVRHDRGRFLCSSLLLVIIFQDWIVATAEMMKLVLLFLLVSLCGVVNAKDPLLLDFQPHVIPVEVDHSHRRVGLVSMPFGSPWCNGKPAVWMIGHQPGHQERPWCLTTADNDKTVDYYDYDYTNSTWQLSTTTVLERQDDLNAENAKRGWRSNIDRHDCIVMDVNFDGLAADIGTFVHGEVS